MNSKMIGFSLSLCVRDIIEGKVALEDVAKITTGTFYTDRDMFHTGMRQDYCRTYWKKDPERAHEIAMYLWDNKLLDQPRTRGKEPPDTSGGHWGAIEVGVVKFVNVAGKYDGDERNTKFISAELDWHEVLKEYENSKGYAFNEIEMYVDGNFVGTVTLKEEGE